MLRIQRSHYVLQWYGNIVTMKWWDNIWLNEGFASFLEYLGLAVAEPAWDIVSEFHGISKI